MFGLLNIDKPAGCTSRDVVNRVQRLVRPHKVGHAGTLDPLATGVLVVAVGPATRLIEYVQRMPKTYRGTFLLGRTSDTEDIEGSVVELSNAPIPTREEITTVIPQFVGRIEQRPPVYSALKIAGKPAYERARRGEEVALAPRPVEIHSIEIIRYQYPELELLAHCGSGTYIRSLGRDLAEALRTGAVMSSLRRLAVGAFRAEDAMSYDNLSAEIVGQRLLSPLFATANLPRVTLSDAEIGRVSRGQTIDRPEEIVGEEIAAVNEHGVLIALLKPIASHALAPVKCFCSAE